MLDNHELAKGAPGLLGSISAMLWLRETGLRRVAAVLIGAAASYYGTPFGLRFFETIDYALMGFLIGLFSMAVASKIFEVVQAFPSDKIFEKLLQKLGL